MDAGARQEMTLDTSVALHTNHSPTGRNRLERPCLFTKMAMKRGSKLTFPVMVDGDTASFLYQLRPIGL